MSKVLGIDLGTNSIGMTLREDDFFKWYGVYTFKKGVGDGKSGEFSLSAERTKHRSTRRLYNSRRYRKWETLKVLIENRFCPLDIQKLKNWKNYRKGIGRIFPVDDEAFDSWIKLDFDCNGKPDYSSPYQLRRELINKRLDLNNETNRYKIGRALYHIAQRRGFKSSRKVGANEKTAVYKGSNETATIGRNEYEDLIEQNKSLGAAFAYLEDEGIRIRNRYTLRSDYRNEVEMIAEFQELDKNFREDVLKAIFFQRPLRSQKGLIGKCTMEPNKARCPLSHPKFEEYRAWSFVNNIKYKDTNSGKFEPLPLDLKKELIQEKLFFKKNKVEFKQIRKFLCSGDRKNWKLNYSPKMDKVSIVTSSVSAYLKEAFGEDWENVQIDVKRKKPTGETYSTAYSLEDIWHILFSFEDEEYLEKFLMNVMNMEENQAKELKKLWNNFPVGYSNLSLKAINNIIPFLKQGLIYSEAVFLAKIPEIIGKELFEDNREGIIEAIEKEIKENRYEKTIIKITNSLIASYKTLDWEEKFAHKDYHYNLDDKDKKEVANACLKLFGKTRWENLAEEKQNRIKSKVEKKYQEFFSHSTRDYLKQPKLIAQIQKFLIKEFNTSQKDLEKLYHPSMIDIYPSKDDQEFLGSPKTRAFKNPMAYKTLHKLRWVINYLIEIGLIDGDTRIVLEVARELNDKNKRAAIEDYQRNRERENIEYGIAISELIKDPEFRGSANPNSEKDINKFRIWTDQITNNEEVQDKIAATKDEIQKYRLWKEQKCQCFYTGRIIKITDLFNSNLIDFEHTIPRSKSFDNSLANLTVCYADYNRNIKNNRIPTELLNYEVEYDGFTPIKPRLDDWKVKVESLHSQIQTQARNSKFAIDKNKKDEAIRRRHLLQMEYEYWKNKVDRFTRKDIPIGFRNSQLVDTQIISKYAYHYLKTVFNQVEVIKGSTTAEFRKIYEIQKIKEKKDRSKHFHHAIDAAVLTLLPTSAKRKEILERAYKYQESYPNQKYHEIPFEGFKYSMIKQIENEILINNIKDQDQILTPAKKYVRKRGTIDYFKNKNGIEKPKIATGDSIRGQLHLDSFYGKIKIAAKDENGSLIRDNKKNIIYNQVNGKDEMWMVIRKPIESVNFKTDIIIDVHLAEYLEKQIEDGKNQNELKDFQGKTLRHLRCRVKAARGFMNPDNATVVKEQVYKSSKDYKNLVYADSGENFMFGLYENDNGRSIVPFNVFETARFIKHINEKRAENLFKAKEPVYIGRGKKSKGASLKHVFMLGQKVLLFENDKEELKDLGNNDLSRKLYFVKRLADAKTQRILFQHHLEARDDKQLTEDFPKNEFGSRGKDGFSKFSSDFVAPRLLLTPGNFSFIIEGKDFEMNLDGSINFKF